MSYTQTDDALDMALNMASGVSPVDLDPDELEEWATFAYEQACRIALAYDDDGYIKDEPVPASYAEAMRAKLTTPPDSPIQKLHEDRVRRLTGTVEHGHDEGTWSCEPYCKCKFATYLARDQHLFVCGIDVAK